LTERSSSSSRGRRPTSVPVHVNPLDEALTAAERRTSPPVRSFAALKLPKPVVRALQREGVITPFAIQNAVLPDALNGRDVLARARTGSGKTLAFGLPMLARLRGVQRVPGRPRGLVIVPTRELARQVAEALRPVATAVDLNVTTVFGGSSMAKQIEHLRRGVDVLVATPGRLIDLMERGEANLDDVEITVLDEADLLADMGFTPDVTKIWNAVPPGAQRMLFSATLDRQVSELVERYLAEPAIHAMAPPPPETENLMTHQVLTVPESAKLDVTATIAARPARTLIFVRTRIGADQLAVELVARGVPAAAIHGDLRQRQRLAVLDAFKAGRTRVMVATDIAARGLHIDDVDLVIHHDVANDHKDYLHRSGRTARAGAAGTVVSLVAPFQSRRLAHLLRDAAISAEHFAVSVEHPIVQALAASGTPVRPDAPRSPDRRGPACREQLDGFGRRHAFAAPARDARARDERTGSKPHRRSVQVRPSSDKAGTTGQQAPTPVGTARAASRPKQRWSTAQKRLSAGNNRPEGVSPARTGDVVPSSATDDRTRRRAPVVRQKPKSAR
jgi:superfamily II DNA/RNA helicase